jgi:hypothetical protein
MVPDGKISGWLRTRRDLRQLQPWNASAFEGIAKKFGLRAGAAGIAAPESLYRQTRLERE